ncbi:hypothetical protein PYW08_010906 [Mythimna loreyi]|uniref:Uncharacterized protein n=1 Tax=Mythimna loreyi TaxID=667449 RepID=A0ACC2Q4K1_9NEOP|nr:hypothetical protein PYW08_010906 [Mythimna loreyi]
MGKCILKGVILAFLAILAHCQNVTETSSNAVPNSYICELCKCENNNVNCSNKNITTFFTREEWKGLKDYEPKIVDLSGNRFINVTVIAHLTIEVLNLSRCSIEFIEDASFKDLEELKVLDLSYNKLTKAKLSPHAFEGSFIPELFKSLASLRTLNLAYNDLHSLHPDLFEHVPKLEQLDLSGNPLTTIDHVTFIAMSGLPMLKVLRLRSCQLDEIPSKFLHTPRYLERLDISDNLLTSVPQELKENEHLVYLNLNQNPILQLDAGSDEYPGFPRLPKLQELHMSYMPKLRRVGEGTLAGLENIQKLHMSFNPALRHLHPKALAKVHDVGESYDWPVVKELYLQSNNLFEVDSRLLSYWIFLEKVDVSGNSFSCNCDTQWMVDTLVPIVENRGGNASLMVCQDPAEMQGYNMKKLHDDHYTMLCVDKYGQPLEKDGNILLGTLIGVLLAIPIMLILMLLWYRGCFACIGLCSPGGASHKSYKRANEEIIY